MEIIIRCSSCNAPLASVRQFNPLNQRQVIPVKQKIIANCCHCGDKSWPLEIEGKIGVGNTEYSVASAVPSEVVIDDTTCGFNIMDIVINTERIKQWK